MLVGTVKVNSKTILMEKILSKNRNESITCPGQILTQIIFENS